MAISSRENRMWGRFEHSLDDKGRVIVPQKFREKLGDEFVLTIGPSRHIRAYPMAIWDTLEEQLASSNLDDELNEDSIVLQRMFESEAAIILGSGTRLELWSRANWETYSTEFTASNAALAISRRSLGIRTGSIPGDEDNRETARGDAG
jgi:MraZ protein